MCSAFPAPPRISPLDLANLFTQSGEVLREFHHHNDKCPSCEHARGPEQRVKDDAVVVQTGQKDSLLLLIWVVVTRDLLFDLQTL